MIFDILFWMLFWSVWIWNRVNGFMATLSLCAETPLYNDITQAYFFSIIILSLTTLMNLPFSIYHTFSIEEKFGLNKTTRGRFFCDQFKTFVLQCLIIAVLIPICLWVIDKSANKVIMILVLAGSLITLNILINFLLPKVILPLFFDLKELEDDELRSAIKEEGRQ